MPIFQSFYTQQCQLWWQPHTVNTSLRPWRLVTFSTTFLITISWRQLAVKYAVHATYVPAPILTTSTHTGLAKGEGVSSRGVQAAQDPKYWSGSHILKTKFCWQRDRYVHIHFHTGKHKHWGSCSTTKNCLQAPHIHCLITKSRSKMLWAQIHYSLSTGASIGPADVALVLLK